MATTPGPTAGSTTASSGAQKAATVRKTNATKRSTTAKKAAETRAANRGATARRTTAARGRTTAAKKAAEAKHEIKNPLERAGEIAEKAVLVPVGAALTAVDEIKSNFGTKAKAKQELRKFERRGDSAMKRIERDARKRRTSIEREIKTVVKDIEKRADPMVKNVELVTARVENAVQSGRTAATKASATVQERIAALV